MSLASWLSWTFSPSHARRAQRRNPAATASRRRRTFRPSLETLEDRVTPSYSLSTLASFSLPNAGSPYSGLIVDGSGNLYGTTLQGGASDDGTVFELAQGSGTLTALASFNGTNGFDAKGTLIVDSSGNLYGTTEMGGASGDGTIFELAHGSSTITTLASFNGTNGEDPECALIMDSSGNLYGTTYGGGASGDGTVFELVPSTGTLTTLVSFNGTNGLQPIGGLIIHSSGNLYGTTAGGGASSDGSVFELAHGSGKITTLASFNSTNGLQPIAGVIMDSSGNLYGTTELGGASSRGTVFELAHGSGTITTLASFNGTNGEDPACALIIDSSGNLYGTTSASTANNNGTVFELAKGPSFAVTGPTSLIAGTAGSFTLTVLNANGTTDTSYSGTVEITSSDPKAILPGNLAISGGTGAFNVTLETAGAQSITATDVNNPSVTGVDTGVAVSPGAASQVVFTQTPSSGTAGQTLGAVHAVLEDAYGNAETGDTSDKVTLSVNTGPSTQMGGTLTETVAAGLATFSNLLLDTSGSYTLAAVAKLAGGGTLGPVVSSAIAVASPVSLAFGNITYNSRTRLYSETVTLTNNTSGTLTGPMSLELTNLPSGVALTDATGTTNGNPYVRFLTSGKTLKKGASTSITLTFTAASLSDITFDTEVVVGL